ncbi:hypothetical protein A3D14_01785 [Candidatus Saccharibacteria bacterium RIFCSPHIGHO2_02_FULL_47_12]|nr:MAG: hypothetical protein A3D14_01785 [Candidatus Saccharibacteria bacterium RIFCSPHIGHO2_02_FULL_47_12]
MKNLAKKLTQHNRDPFYRGYSWTTKLMWLLRYLGGRATAQIRKLRWTTLITILAILSILPTSIYAASIAQGYTSSDKGLQVGMAASLVNPESGTTGEVEAATNKTQDKFVGIVTTKDTNSVVITDKNQTVYITTEGQTKALVSDVGGLIKQGDHLTLSPLRGYLMKGNSSDLKSVAVALEDFPSQNNTKVEVKDVDNQIKAVQAASMGVEVRRPEFVDVTYSKRPLLTNFARSLTGKEVSQWQVIIALVIFFVLLVAIGSVIYSAVHSTIEALGRNPLAKADIYKEFMQVLLISVAILIFGGLMIFVLLWL